MISESQYEKWSAAWTEAEHDYQMAEELKQKLMDRIEVNLELLGNFLQFLIFNFWTDIDMLKMSV